MESVIGTTDIVLGTFADPSSPAGIDAIIITGREAMRETGSTKFSITAIPCERRERAVAALQMWGDGTIDLKPYQPAAGRAADPISRQHYREMAAHYRALSIEQMAMREPETAH